MCVRRPCGEILANLNRQEILRAEIETMRSGSDASDRWVIQLFSRALVHPLSVSVKSLELQITELEHESERMSRAQEAQRAVMSEVEAAAAKKVDDISKDISKKACWTSNYALLQLILISSTGRGDRAAEAEVKAIS